MDLDGPREPKSMSMDTADARNCHPHRRDTVEIPYPSDPSGERMSFNFNAQDHQTAGPSQTLIRSLSPDCEHLPGPDDSPQLVMLASTSSTDHSGGTEVVAEATDVDVFPGLKPVTSRKRKHTHDLPQVLDHNHAPYDSASAGGADPQSGRRTRPRIQTRRDREFSPLLIMSPDASVEEETISAFHFSPIVTDLSHSIRRYFHLDDTPAHGSRILQSGSSLKVDDLEDRKGSECSRSASASSFTEVALASTATRTYGRLSTLQDFGLPRPFEETDRPSSSGVVVHERGLDAPPLLRSTSGDRMGGLWVSCKSTDSPTDTLGHPIRVSIHEHGIHAVSPQTALEGGFFDKPICDSPDSITPEGDGLTGTRFEPSVAQTTHGAQFDSTPHSQSVRRTTGNSDQ